MNRRFKISRGDRRVGNFVYHLEKDAVKVSDINSMVSHRISTFTPKGQMVAMAVEQKDKEDWLMAYAVTVFNVLSCIPDATFMEELNRSTVECIDRHPEIYNIKRDIDKAEDDAIVDNERDLHRVAEELKEGADGND